MIVKKYLGEEESGFKFEVEMDECQPPIKTMALLMKSNGQLMFQIDPFVKLLGFATAEDFFGSDFGLDMISKHKEGGVL